MGKSFSKRTLRKISILLLDVDGVLTDGRIYYGDNGTEHKAFDAHDGYGITRAMEHGLKIGFITGRQSSIVERRARELGVTDVFQNSVNKVAAFEQVKSKYKIDDDEAAYMGDDLFDLPLLKKVGLSIAPKNAVEEVKDSVDFVTKAKGGRGAVREAIDMILEAQG